MFRRCPKRLLKALFSLNLYQVSMEYLIEYMFLSFIVHYDTPHFETYFNTYYNKKLITRNYSELQRPTTIQKKCETIRNGHTTTQNGWDNVHNDPQQCKTNPDTAQKLKFCIKDFFDKCEQIRNFLRIWSYLQKKYLMENFIFSAMTTAQNN